MLLSFICTTLEKRRRGCTPGRLEYTRGVHTASAGKTQFKIPGEAVRTPLAYCNLQDVQLRKRFIPRWESAKQMPYGDHLSILYFIQFVPGSLPEMWISPAETKMPKYFIAWMDGWMGGWMGCDFLPFSIFLICKYDKKQHTSILTLCLKVARAF